MSWKISKERKPLVLRGARQVGKTTIINSFGSTYSQYIYLNLEKQSDVLIFENQSSIEHIIQSIFFNKDKNLSDLEETLLFIDEIQAFPKAIQWLRYFYEDFPKLHVIAAGSLLESLFNFKESFPVGRVQYLILRPVSFSEFLLATGESSSFEMIQKIPFPDFALEKLYHLFQIYVLIGGMPEVVNNYLIHRDLLLLENIYFSLLNAYLDDVFKYAKSETQANYLSHCIRTAFLVSGNRIKYQGFGNSNYKSKDISESLKILEKAFLLNLFHPINSNALPIIPNLKQSPKLQVLDIGLFNYSVGIQKDLLNSKKIEDVFKGQIVEQIVGQELLSHDFHNFKGLNFWVREKSTSLAEVDYIFLFEGLIIPIEVKSGKSGRLKSLILFMETAPHQMAVRFYSSEVMINKIVINEEKYFYLLSLPYFLVNQLNNYLYYFMNEIEKLETLPS